MRPLFSVWKIIFTRSTSKNFKVAFLDFFWLQWLSGFQALLVLIFQGIQAKKTQKNIENGNLEGKSQLIWPPSIWVGQPCPIGPRGVPIKNLVRIMMFEAKNSTFLQSKTHFKSSLKKKYLPSLVFCWIWMDYGHSRCPIWNFLLISDGTGYGGYPPARKVARPPL